MLAVLKKFVKWSVLASAALALAGAVVALIAKIPVLEGAYTAVLIGAVVPMLGAVLNFASPRIRKGYMAGEADDSSKGAVSLPFAISGLLMMGIAFLIEAMTH